MQRRLALIIPMAVIACTVRAQPPDTFEAAIVRPSGPDSVFKSDLTASQFTATRNTLQMLIQSSYPDLPSWRITGGPSWVTKDQWDFVAKLPPGSPTDQELLYRKTEEMLRTFLADNFKLKTHFTQSDQPVYDLVLAKSGAKIKRSEGSARSFRVISGGVEIRHETMEEFASFLSCSNCGRADRPVFDKTGLDGYYDFVLNWSPSNAPPDAATLGPSIFTALEEQLGLKLQPAKALIDFLVIDSAERPAGN